MKIIKMLKKNLPFCKTDKEKNFKKYRTTLKETKKIYSIKDKYTQKRYALHIKIANEFMKEASAANNGKRPIAVLIGGGTASGKTTMRKNIEQQGVYGVTYSSISFIKENDVWKLNIYDY